MTGTNVTTDERKEERAEIKALVEALPVEAQTAITLTRMAAFVAKEIAKLSWGQNLSGPTARAIAQWGLENGLDPLTEIDLLGGRPYHNARFYARRLGELVEERKVDWFRTEMVHRDPRLDELGDEGKALQRERALLRVKHGIPEAATGAALFLLKLHELSEPIIGVNWCGGGTGSHKANGKGDPVGDKEPVKTAETRAMRRAVMLARGHIPKLAQQVKRAEDTAKIAWQPLVQDDKEQLEAEAERSGITHRHVVGSEDSYGAPQITTGAPAVEVHDAGTPPVEDDRAIDAEIAGHEPRD